MMLHDLRWIFARSLDAFPVDALVLVKLLLSDHPLLTGPVGKNPMVRRTCAFQSPNLGSIVQWQRDAFFGT